MKILFNIGLIFVLATGFCSSAEETPTPIKPLKTYGKAICEGALCQQSIRIQLKLSDGSNYDKTFTTFPPVVQNNGITIAAGQNVNIEAAISGDSLINFKVVDTIVDPKKTIMVSFKQQKNGGMRLTTKSPFARKLKFNMAIMLINEDKLVITASCHNYDKGIIYSTWPYPITQIFLSDLMFRDPKKTYKSCDY